MFGNNTDIYTYIGTTREEHILAILNVYIHQYLVRALQRCIIYMGLSRTYSSHQMRVAEDGL